MTGLYQDVYYALGFVMCNEGFTTSCTSDACIHKYTSAYVNVNICIGIDSILHKCSVYRDMYRYAETYTVHEHVIKNPTINFKINTI